MDEPPPGLCLGGRGEKKLSFALPLHNKQAAEPEIIHEHTMRQIAIGRRISPKLDPLLKISTVNTHIRGDRLPGPDRELNRFSIPLD